MKDAVVKARVPEGAIARLERDMHILLLTTKSEALREAIALVHEQAELRRQGKARADR